MFRAMFTPIISSTLLYLQYLVVFTQDAAGWCPVGTATGWSVRGSNPGGAKFSAPVQTGPGPTQPPVQWVPGLSRG